MPNAKFYVKSFLMALKLQKRKNSVKMLVDLNFYYFSGKQRDFFTRTWGEDFTENSPIPPSPYVCELSINHFEKYLRKLRKYCPRHCKGGQHKGHVKSRT